MPSKIITTEKEEQRLEQLYKNFVPMREIAKEFQCCERTIWKTIKELGFTREKSKKPKAPLKKLTLKEEEEIAAIGYNMTGQQLAEKYEVGINQIKKIRKKYGLSWSELHDYSQYNNYIIEQWDWRTAASLAQEIGCSKSYIEKVWINAGLQNKGCNIYHVDKHFLDNIDSHEKAWFIGLLAADGCLYKRNNLIYISLQKKDKETIEQIKNILKADNPIHETERNGRKYYSLSICNKQLYSRLIEIGLMPKKTWILDFNLLLKNIPEEFHSSLFRGYWDGDGTIMFNERGASYCAVSIVAPWETILIFQEYLNKKFGFSFSVLKDVQKKYKYNFGTLFCKNTFEKYCLIKWLYSYKPAMQRKKENKEKLCALIENNKTNRSENKLAVLKWEELLEAWNGNQQPSQNALF